MAQRTTTADVQAILVSNKQYDGTTSLQPFIDTAVVLVDWIVTKDTDSELSASALERIEAYLAAHFYGHADQFFTSKNTGRASAAFQGQTAMVLMATYYGQTACLLDVTGNLSARSKDAEQGKKSDLGLGVEWMGKPPTEQTDYEDRD